MTDIEKKAEEKLLTHEEAEKEWNEKFKKLEEAIAKFEKYTKERFGEDKCKRAYKDGYEQGQADANLYYDGLLKQTNDFFEKENAELKAQNEELKGYERVIKAFKSEGFDSSISVKEYCQNYAKLLKENAELKKQNEELHWCEDWPDDYWEAAK